MVTLSGRLRVADAGLQELRNESTAWLKGGGDVGRLMRSCDWSASPLGAPETWPQSLRSVAGLLLGSKFPMFVAWGEELGFLYNDAYAEILGEKHPAALGGRFRDIWPEIWPDIWPLIEAAMDGEASFREDLPLLISRHGFDEPTWFTFSYSPVRDETGQVAGMFCACVETTQRVRDERRQAFLFELDDCLDGLDTAERILEATAAMLGAHLSADRVHWASVNDAQGTFWVQREWGREGVPSLVGEHSLDTFGGELIEDMRAGLTVDVEDALSAQDSAGTTELEAFVPAIRGILAIPLFRGPVWREALCVHTLTPRRWRDDERELIREVAERAWTRAQRAQAEADVRANEQHLRLMVHELNHRVKNSLAIVQAMTAQTLRRGEIPDEVRDALASRLVALASAHDVLTDEKWSGADLRDLIAQTAAPYTSLAGASPFVVEGPPVFLPPKAAIAMALAFHELATNAAKYGALSRPGGEVSVLWTLIGPETPEKLRLTWRERGGPAVPPPTRRGFGTRLIERGLASELKGQVRLDYAPEGLVCTLEGELPAPAYEPWNAPPL